MCYCDQANTFHLTCYQTILRKTTHTQLVEANVRLLAEQQGGNKQT